MTMAEVGLEKRLKFEAEVETEHGTKVKLEKIKYVVMHQFDASLLEGQVDVQFWEDYSQEFFVARVVGFVWGEDFAQRTIRYPRDWFEAVKERWAPRWYRRWSPVRYKVHNIEAKAYYPGISPSMPDQPWRIAAYLRDLDEEEEDETRDHE